MQSTVGIVFAAIGLGLGLGLAYLMRGWRKRSDQRKRAATPVVYSSRQEARKAAREREKTQRKAR